MPENYLSEIRAVYNMVVLKPVFLIIAFTYNPLMLNL